MKRIFRSKIAWGIAIAAASALGMFGYNQVNAGARQDCDNNAIIYCGAQSPSEFVSKATANNPADLQGIYEDFGLAPSEYSKFVTSAKMGTAYKDGRIVVDGQTVATDAWSIGRQGNHNGQTFKREYTIAGHTYYASNNKDIFLSDSIPVMVMFDDKGAMKFAALTACGNPITGHKTNPNYSCDLLQKAAVEGQENTYSFTTKASATNGATLAKVVYDFGDGSGQVTKTSLSDAVTHTYAKAGDYTAKVTVYVTLPGGGQIPVTGAQCQTQITVEAPPVVAYNCDSLQALPGKEELSYTFQANTSATNATLTGADFDFGDGTTSQNVTPGTNATVASVDHTYADAGEYTAKATVHFQAKGDDSDQAVKSATCEVKISTKVCSTNPNLPPNSPECQPCKYNNKLPHDSPKCKAKPVAKVLPNTGAGDVIGLFAGASLVGFVGYRFYLSRRFLRG
jgi:hypothetical protein